MTDAKTARTLLRMANIRADEMEAEGGGGILKVEDMTHCIYFTIAFARIVSELEANETKPDKPRAKRVKK